MTAFTFSARGTPRPQPRPRFIKGRAVSTANPKAKLWRLAVERAVIDAMACAGPRRPLFAGAVKMRCTFTFAPSASEADRLGRPHTHKPDADNLAKLVMDAMETFGVFKNDSQVSKPTLEKVWGTRPGVVVTVEPMGDVRRAEPMLTGGDVPGWLRE